VFAVVDAYDAMTSRRPYRTAMARDTALIEIASHSGTQFDHKVVQAFLQVIRRSPDGFYEESEDDQFGSRISHPYPHDAEPSERTLVTR
jgi:HD-GYP domain-containing protein (c-di-GMP phosphodiesterase class II)